MPVRHHCRYRHDRFDRETIILEPASVRGYIRYYVTLLF